MILDLSLSRTGRGVADDRQAHPLIRVVVREPPGPPQMVVHAALDFVQAGGRPVPVDAGVGMFPLHDLYGAAAGRKSVSSLWYIVIAGPVVNAD